MTPKQLLEKMQTNLKAMVWGVTSNRIFGDEVFIVPEFPVQNLNRFRFPSVFIMDAGGVPHAEHSRLWIQNFSISVVVENVQSALGEGVMVGANRVANTSTGAGILDIEDELFDKLTVITGLEGAKVMLVEKSAPKVQTVSGNNFPLIMRIFSFSALVGLY